MIIGGLSQMLKRKTKENVLYPGSPLPGTCLTSAQLVGSNWLARIRGQLLG